MTPFALICISRSLNVSFLIHPPRWAVPEGCVCVCVVLTVFLVLSSFLLFGVKLWRSCGPHRRFYSNCLFYCFVEFQLVLSAVLLSLYAIKCIDLSINQSINQ